MIEAVALHTDFRSGFVDHIAPVCVHFDIPYLFLDPIACERALKYYPELDARCAHANDLIPEVLSKNYKALLITQPCSSYENMYSIFVPHGNSDKGHSCNALFEFEKPDLVFVYGKRMLALLEEKKVQMKDYVVVGNMRYHYFQKHRSFFEKIIEDEVLRHCERGKKRILYAPTWDQYDGTFFEAYEALFDNLPDEYQLIVKLHPYLLELHLGMIEKIKGKYEKKKNLLFLDEMPLIYPLLDKIDVYVGDTSSVGYDFLAFDRPLFFLNKHGKEKQFFLERCGTTLYPEEFKELYDKIENEKRSFSKTRQDVYEYTFESRCLH